MNKFVVLVLFYACSIMMLFTACDGGGDDGGSLFGTCSFTVSDEYSGTYTGDATIVQATGYLNFICDGSRDGTVADYPQITIAIKTDNDSVTPGTYVLSDNNVGTIHYRHDSTTTYSSSASSASCTATFTDSDSATFACTDIPKSIPDGTTVDISNGSGDFF